MLHQTGHALLIIDRTRAFFSMFGGIEEIESEVLFIGTDRRKVRSQESAGRSLVEANEASAPTYICMSAFKSQSTLNFQCKTNAQQYIFMQIVWIES